MKKISLVTFKEHLKNEIFFTENPFLNIDGLLEPFRMLRQQFFELGYDLSTCDINSIDEADLIFYFHIDTNTPYPQMKHKNKSYFFIWECQIITPEFYEPSLHNYFNKVFTFRDDLVDNVTYFKINYSFNIPTKIEKNLDAKTKLCTLIAGHKLSNNDIELYSERIRAIKWFECHHSSDFDLYGRGWNKYVSGNRIVNKVLNKFKPLRKIFEYAFWDGYPSYKGEVSSKLDVLNKYKFSICYENARNIPGYITEKILHSLFAGCVPIYYGANNIKDYIPESCFIDKRDFATYEELYFFIANMSDTVYVNYLDNIDSFLKNKKIKVFSSENFCDDVINTIYHQLDLCKKGY